MDKKVELKRKVRRRAATTAEILGAHDPSAPVCLVMSDGTTEVMREHEVSRSEHIAAAPLGATSYVFAEPPPPKLKNLVSTLRAFRKNHKLKVSVRCPICGCKVNPLNLSRHKSKVHGL